MGYLRLPSNVLVEESMYRRNKSSPKTTKEKKASVSNDVEEAHFHGDGAAAAEPEHRQRRVRWSWFVAAPLVACVLVSFFTLSRPPEQSLGWNNFEEDYHRRYRRAPPKSLEQWLTFALKHECEPMRFYDVIERDLAIFRNQSLSYDKVVEEATKYTDYFAAYQVKDNRLLITNFQTIFDMTLVKRFETFNLQNSLSWLFRPLQNHKPPLDAKFVLNLRDQPTDKRNATYPIFSACHKSRFNDNLTYPETHATTREDESITRDLLVPYYFSIGVQHRGLWFWPFYSRGPSWRQRKDSIVWRGSTTGLPWGDSPRFWLLEQYGAKGVHEIVPGVDADFAFVRVVQNYDGQALPEKYRRAEAISYRDIQQHKYVLDVDGNSFTERFPKLLRSGSLVFKSTTYREWFSERLQPWVDYIPVDYDLSDLKEKIEWAHSNQDLAERIAEHGRKTVERHIRPEDQQCYTYRLLLEYNALFDS